MGCDGGTIPKRHELVKTAKRPAEKDKDMERSAKWSNCAINQQPLSAPIMTCELGKLYSKESLLEFLLDHSISDNAAHVRNLKDVKELKLTPNPGYDKRSTELADRYCDTQASKYVCPIVGLEMNGKFKFCALWTCGCVLSERALKEVETENCLVCGTKFMKEDMIIINPENDDIELMEISMKMRREKLKVLRKEKKDKRSEKRKIDNNGSLSSNGSTAVNNSKQAAEVITKRTRKVNGINGETAGSSKIPSKKADTKSSTNNISTDVSKSKVYKSLFTSSEDAKNHKNAHWVTYNPYHL